MDEWDNFAGVVATSVNGLDGGANGGGWNIAGVVSGVQDTIGGILSTNAMIEKARLDSRLLEAQNMAKVLAIPNVTQNAQAVTDGSKSAGTGSRMLIGLGVAVAALVLWKVLK